MAKNSCPSAEMYEELLLHNSTKYMFACLTNAESDIALYKSFMNTHIQHLQLVYNYSDSDIAMIQLNGYNKAVMDWMTLQILKRRVIDIMIGKTVHFNGVDLLVLDETSEEYFVWAYNTGVRSIFNLSGRGKEYHGSILQNSVAKWAADVNLLFNDPSPLTTSQYKKYKDIMKPYITKPFWLRDNDESTFYARFVCNDGSLYNGIYSTSGCLAPAFYISKEYIDSNINNNTQERKEETTMEKTKKLYLIINENDYEDSHVLLMSEDQLKFFRYLRDDLDMVLREYDLIPLPEGVLEIDS